MILSLVVVIFLAVIYYIQGFYSHGCSLRLNKRIVLSNNRRDINNVPKSANTSGKSDNKKGFTLGNLFQLVAMGAGAPVLGEYKETDENGKMLFELEANNFSDKDGNSLQSKAPFFENGYEGDRFEESPPNFWKNLLSGGRLQAEWENRAKKNKL